MTTLNSLVSMFTKHNAPMVIGYMAVVLAIGTFLISKLKGQFDNCIIRKLFHLLAFITFTPCVLYDVKETRLITNI